MEWFVIIPLLFLWWIFKGCYRCYVHWSKEHGDFWAVVMIVGYMILLPPVSALHFILKGMFGWSADQWEEHYLDREADHLIAMERRVRRRKFRAK